MPLPLEQYLAPVSPESPCGSNAYDDLDLGGIISSSIDAIVGNDDGGMVSGERSSEGTGDWSGLLANVGAYFGQTKHLGLARFALIADLHLGGLTGLADGIVLINQLLSRFWDEVHPVIEDGDADERLEILAALEDPLIIAGLGEIVVCKGKRAGAYTLDQVTASQTEGEPSPTLVDASINETLSERPDFYEKLAAQLSEVRQQLNFLRGIVKEHLESASLRFPGVEAKLVMLEGFLGKVGSGVSVPAGDTGDEGGETPAAAGAAPQAAAPGEIRNRADVCRQIDQIIRFYSKTEPTSPVPHLLERVKRVVNMNFMEIVDEFRLTGNPSIPDLFGKVENS